MKIKKSINTSVELLIVIALVIMGVLSSFYAIEIPFWAFILVGFIYVISELTGWSEIPIMKTGNEDPDPPKKGDTGNEDPDPPKG